MENRSEHIDRLIVRYFSGEALPEEALEIEQWIDESSENKKYFEGFQFIAQQVNPGKKYEKVNSDKAWEKVSIQMKAMGKSALFIEPLPFYKTSWFRYAASFVLIIGLTIGLLIYNSGRNRFISPVLIASNDSVLHQSLSPNIEISLNRNSHITYRKTKSGKKNEVQLTGEAFIEVQHSKDTLFIVRADETFIRDIGTSFNVRAYPDSSTVEVYVESGMVTFYTGEQKGLNLKKGETGIYNKKTKTFTLSIAPLPNVTAYKTKCFVFRNTRLSDAVKALNEVYSQRILLADTSLAVHTITVTFHNEPLDSLVSIIAETLELKVHRDSSGYVLQARE